jgi:hypothetical protein
MSQHEPGCKETLNSWSVAGLCCWILFVVLVLCVAMYVAMGYAMRACV